MTVRRHVQVDSVTLIGKESNKVGDSGEAHPHEDHAVASFQDT